MVRVYFSYEEPPRRADIESKLESLAQQLELGPGNAGILQSFRDFYSITDGMIVDVGLKVFGLVKNRFETLESVNSRFLDLVMDSVENAHLKPTILISLIFGSDEAGDFLCLSHDGAVIRVGHDATEAPVIASSLDVFFNDLCFGFGFIRYYRPNSDDPWVSILREFGFL